MTRTRTLHRWTLAALAAATLTITIAQSAQADPGWRRWKQLEHGRRAGHSVRVVYRDGYRDGDRGGAGPVLAGLIGGFVLGATMTHPHAVVVRESSCAPPPRYVHEREYAPPPPRYRYEDANGDRWWDTLDECREAAFERYGPRVIKVVDDRTGQCVQTYYWSRDHFVPDTVQGDEGRGRNDDNRDDD